MAEADGKKFDFLDESYIDPSLLEPDMEDYTDES